jgi:hypothetical protein
MASKAMQSLYLWFVSKDTWNSIFDVGTLMMRTWPMIRAHRDSDRSLSWCLDSTQTFAYMYLETCLMTEHTYIYL